MERNPYRRRIKLLVDILNEVINKQEEMTRKEVVEILRKTYEKHRIKPLKGKANPPDLYDKELSSLYVVGKYGLGLDEDYPRFFNKVFYIEEVFEKCIEKIMKGDSEGVRELLKTVSLSGVIDSNTVARMLRIPFTKLLLGFIEEEEFAEILLKTKEVLPEEERTVRNYVRFYIAFKTAEAIYRGEIKNKMYKEAYKRALAVRLGFPRSTPSDEYIAIIGKEVFNLSDELLKKTLSIEKQ
ncbi:MAG: hypothetical protein B6U89_05200 [Desulfurococcales archaeon ex4484_58]|nr:MAG: hypothetical protein B6U89_05200 [Desulfurococcales archaeon ex4484_58]